MQQRLKVINISSVPPLFTSYRFAIIQHESRENTLLPDKLPACYMCTSAELNSTSSTSAIHYNQKRIKLYRLMLLLFNMTPMLVMTLQVMQTVR